MFKQISPEDFKSTCDYIFSEHTPFKYPQYNSGAVVTSITVRNSTIMIPDSVIKNENGNVIKYEVLLEGDTIFNMNLSKVKLIVLPQRLKYVVPKTYKGAIITFIPNYNQNTANLTVEKRGQCIMNFDIFPTKINGLYIEKMSMPTEKETGTIYKKRTIQIT